VAVVRYLIMDGVCQDVISQLRAEGLDGAEADAPAADKKKKKKNKKRAAEEDIPDGKAYLNPIMNVLFSVKSQS
jgi:hypothetical protein